MEKDDRKFLEAMMESAEFASGCIEGKTRQDLNDDRQLSLSLVKSLEMISEASARVSKACQNACEPIPWDVVIEIKQQVVHTYWEIDRDWVWEKISKELPNLIKALEEALSSK